MRVAELVGRVLAAHGVRHVFGVVGSGNFHVTNALVAGGARFYPAAHEGGAACMADGFAPRQPYLFHNTATFVGHACQSTGESRSAFIHDAC